MKANRPLRLLVVGFGNVGRQLARIFTHKNHSRSLEDPNFVVVGITTGRSGALVRPEGLDLKFALSEMDRSGCFLPSLAEYSEMGSLEAARSLEYDALVELTTLNIEQRGEPAFSHIRAALERGRHVVTANKGPIAFSNRELQSLAQSNCCRLLHEATVMDGAPVFNLARYCLKGCRILKLEGILNSTTNFVLSSLESGGSFEDAVRIAQQRGFAEADPSHDLEGWDAAAKICVLANVLLGGDITPPEVKRTGILGIGARDVRAALKKGRRWKLVCRASRRGEQLLAEVSLEKVAESHPFFRVTETGNILRISTDRMGPLLIQQEAPTLCDTACGVLGDLLLLRDCYTTWEKGSSVAG